jgi:hypothetical protein
MTETVSTDDHGSDVAVTSQLKIAVVVDTVSVGLVRTVRDL